MRWLLQFTVREDETKQNRKLPEIALFDNDGNPIDLSSIGHIATWAPDTNYKLGQVVVNSGHLYQAVDDHTSGAVFGGDSAHWTALDPETDALALSQLATHAGLTTTAHGGIVSSADSRLTNARTPTAHKTSHAVGGSDVLSPADIGAVSSADSRLTDPRTPTAHKTSHAVGGSDALSPADIGAATAADLTAEQTARTTHAGLTTTAHGGIVSSADSRLTNARTPTAHKTSHAVGGSDVLSPADIGAATAADLTTEQTARATHAALTTTAHGGIVASDDPRLTDQRPPASHKTTHGAGGSDPISPADIGAVAASLIDAKGDLFVGSADNIVARLAVGANGKVLKADSTQTTGTKWADAADVQEFAAGSGQTWTKPPGVTALRVICVGAGGGGGGGASAVNALKSGGSGGAGGAVLIQDLLASQVGATETVNVGAGGSGGAGGAAGAGASGSPGTNGGDSDFASSLVKAGGGSSGSAGSIAAGFGGNGGAAGAVSAFRTTNADALGGQGVISSSGAAGKSTEYGGASGGSGSTTGAQDGGSSMWGGSGGGNGGRVTAANAGGSGGAGGSNKSYSAGGGGTAGTVGPPPTAGGAGGAGPAPYCGQGGGGGGGGTAVAGAAGGNGGRGCGGGGGGSSSSATSSAAGAAGGNGGDGRVIVISW